MLQDCWPLMLTTAAVGLCGVSMCFLALGTAKEQWMGFALFLLAALMVFGGLPVLLRYEIGNPAIHFGAQFAMAVLGVVGALVAVKVSHRHVSLLMKVFGGLIPYR